MLSVLTFLNKKVALVPFRLYVGVPTDIFKLS